MSQSATLNSRREAAQRILAAPASFKVCEGCGSIVVIQTALCPNCNAYRFDPDPASVRRQAEMLAQREPLSIEQTDYE